MKSKGEQVNPSKGAKNSNALGQWQYSKCAGDPGALIREKISISLIEQPVLGGGELAENVSHAAVDLVFCEDQLTAAQRGTQELCKELVDEKFPSHRPSWIIKILDIAQLISVGGDGEFHSNFGLRFNRLSRLVIRLEAPLLDRFTRRSK